MWFFFRLKGSCQKCSALLSDDCSVIFGPGQHSPLWELSVIVIGERRHNKKPFPRPSAQFRRLGADPPRRWQHVSDNKIGR